MAKGNKPGIFARIGHWFKSLKAEFRKVIWPDKEKIYKESVTVVTATVCLAVIIAAFDVILQYGIKLLVG